MRGKYFHEKTSLELLTYVLTGRGEKSEGTISIEWIASPRSFSLFIDGSDLYHFGHRTVHWHCMCSISQQMENGQISLYRAYK